MNVYPRRAVHGRLGAALDGIAKSGRGRIVALRGRRQVGKSTAVTAYVEACGVGYVYLTGIKGASTGAQLSQVPDAVRAAVRTLPGGAAMFAEPPSSWRDFFGRLAVAAERGPIVVVLDEFPWLIEADRSLEGELQIQWDRLLEHLPVLLVLIGSDVAMMRGLSEHDRPLFGRTTPVTVPPLDPAEIARALPGASAAKAFDAYLVTGGFPRLVTSCAAMPTVEDYVRQALEDPLSDLVVTARLSLMAEFADSESAYRVLSAIGGSRVANPGFNDVLSTMSSPEDRAATQTAITRALATLSSGKELIAVDVPAGAAGNSKLRRYRVLDPYLRFWFTFVEREVDHIARGRSDIPVRRFDAGWSSWRGQAVESVVNDSLVRLAAVDERLAGIETVGGWWNRDHSVEVDSVLSGPAGPLAIGSIKWRRGSVTSAEVAGLAGAREVIPHAEGARLIAVTAQAGRRVSGLDLALNASDLLGAWR